LGEGPRIKGLLVGNNKEGGGLWGGGGLIDDMEACGIAGGVDAKVGEESVGGHGGCGVVPPDVEVDLQAWGGFFGAVEREGVGYWG